MPEMTQNEKKRPDFISGHMPILHWLPRYSKSWLTGDIVAGLSVWALMVPQAHTATLIVGIIALVILFALKIVTPKVPGALVALVLGIGASTILDLHGMGVAVVGKVPQGFPTPALPVISLITKNLNLVVSAAICVVLVGFSESLAAARQYASKFHYDIDVNQEMLAQGMANLTAGIFQSINVDGSLSKSSVNVASGAKSQMASLAQGAFVILTFLVLAPLFANLPEAVLGAIVIQAVVFGLMDVKAMKRIYRLNRTEFWVGIIALLSVLTFGTLQGVINGLLMSLAVLVARSSKPEIPVLGKLPGTKVFHRLENHPDSETYPGLVIVRFDGPLFFATANALRDKVQSVRSEATPAVKTILIDMEGVDYIDLEGADMLGEITENMKNAGVEIHIARTKQAVLSMLKKVGIDRMIGQDRIHENVFEAVHLFTSH